MSLSKESLPIVRHCWICYSEESFGESNPGTSNNWVEPCSCTGATKWVHQICIQQWVDSCLRKSINETVKCPSCQYPYKIYSKEPDVCFVFLDKLVNLLDYCGPVALTGTILMAIYWLFFTFGAITILQIFGKIEGMYILYHTNPVWLFGGVPFIPFTLIIFKYSQWDDYCVQCLYRLSLKIIHLCRSDVPRENLDQYEEFLNGRKSSVNLSAIILEAFAYPTITVLCSKLFIRSIDNIFGQLACGAAAYFFIKSTVLIIYKRYNLFYLSERRILNHFDDFDTDH